MRFPIHQQHSAEDWRASLADELVQTRVATGLEHSTAHIIKLARGKLQTERITLCLQFHKQMVVGLAHVLSDQIQSQSSVCTNQLCALDNPEVMSCSRVQLCHAFLLTGIQIRQRGLQPG